MDAFWNTIILYNNSTWLYQYIIAAVAIVLTFLLLRYPKEWVKVAMKLFMSFVYGWISIAYYFISSNERNHNDVMSIFWGGMALVWLWDAITGYTSFIRTHKYDLVAYILLVMPIVYPLLSLARGLAFPQMAFVVMPSSIVVFTLGLLLLFAYQVNLLLILFLCHWSFIALTKTYLFKVPEDFLMALVAVPALYILFRANFFVDLNEITKPSAKSINYMLIGVFASIAVLLIVFMYFTVAE